VPSLPNAAVRRFAWLRLASVAWKVAAVVANALLYLKLTGGF